jgi:Flp pilus assembly protein TadG
MIDRRERHGEEGQALVELAIVLPVLLLILVGIMEFSLLLYNQQVITNASREGARFGIVARTPRRTAAQIDSVVASYCDSHLVTFGSGLPTSSTAATGTAFGDDLTVTVTYPYDFLVLPSFIGDLAGGMNLQAWSTMKYE